MNTSPIQTSRERVQDSTIRITEQQQWGVFYGTVHVFITGPNMGSMWKVTDAYYKGQVGTDEERRIARNAVVLLSRERRYETNPTEAMVMEAMDRARRALAAGEPDPVQEEEDEEPGDVVIGDFRDRGWHRTDTGGFVNDDGTVAADTTHRNKIDFQRGLIVRRIRP